VTAAVAPHGLAALAGSSHDVGVVGYTLGGGLSFLARSRGLAANSVTAIELVTADGEFRRVDTNHDPDLFWALRGGGGNFAAVTALEFRLYPIAEVYAGMMIWPWERSEEVLKCWRDLTDSLPDEMTTIGRILQVPPLPDIPEPVRGRQLVVIEAIYDGDAAEGAEMLAPLLALEPEMSTLATIPAAGLQMLHMDPPEPVPGASDYSMLDALPDEAIEAVVALAGPGSNSPLLSVEFRQLGGEIAEARPHHGARGTFPGSYLMFAVGMVMSPEMKTAIESHAGLLVDALSAHRSKSGYLNFAENGCDPAELYDADSYARLCEIKAAYDPANLFRANHAIPAAVTQPA
jgi:FAD/FMN-containing dehydrogenase